MPVYLGIIIELLHCYNSQHAQAIFETGCLACREPSHGTRLKEGSDHRARMSVVDRCETLT